MARHSFKQLREKMSAEQRSQAETRAREMLAEMLLAEIRQAVGLTQEQVAASLGIKQPTLSRLESQHDMQVSTLQRLVQALGGELEVLVHLPSGTIRVRQFDDAA